MHRLQSPPRAISNPFLRFSRRKRLMSLLSTWDLPAKDLQYKTIHFPDVSPIFERFTIQSNTYTSCKRSFLTRVFFGKSFKTIDMAIKGSVAHCLAA